MPCAAGVGAAAGDGAGRGAAARCDLRLAVPHEKSDVIARLHEVGQVIERHYEGDMARFKARIPPHFHREFERFVVRELQTA